MRNMPWVVLALAVIAVVSPAAADEQAELKRLAGNWTIVTVGDGEHEREMPPSEKIVFEGKMIGFCTLPGGGAPIGTVTRIDATSKPAEIDIQRFEECGTVRGIYELSGDDLKLLLPRVGAERPNKFKGNGAMYLKREKKPHAEPSNAADSQ